MKTKTLLTLIFSCVIISVAQAQTKFSRVFWATVETPYLVAVAQTSDGGYIEAGKIRDASTATPFDIFLVRFNSAGDTLWTKRFGGSGTDQASSVQQTNDGGFIIAGYTDSYGAGNFDALLVKTDSLGNISWAKTFGGVGADEANSVRQNSDNGYIVAATFRDTSSKLLVIRTDVNGDTLWTKKFWSGDVDAGFFAVQTFDGGFAVSGSGSYGSFSSYKGALIMKLTLSGNASWTHGFYYLSETIESRYVTQTPDGGYILNSEATFGSVTASAYLNRFDAAGNSVFGKNFYSPYFDTFSSVRSRQLPDGTYQTVANALTVPATTGSKVILIKCASNGDTLWNKTIDKSSCSEAIFTSDDGIALATTTSMYSTPPGIIKIDSSLNAECSSFQNYTTGYTLFNQTVANVPMSSAAGLTMSSPALSVMNYQPRRMYTPCMPNVPTCVVTVDSIAQKNLVVWEENFDTTFVDSYQVYKESSVAGVYNLIGSVPHNQFSTFLDIASNPAVQAERYRMTALWHSFYEPPPATASHKTIHLNINLGLPPSINLIWSSYVGFTYSTYNIWRGNGTTANIIASVPFGTNSYTDLTPPAGDSLYFIEVVNTPCNPSFIQPYPGNGQDEELRALTSQYAGTRSNIVNRGAIIGINEIASEAVLNLFPNPAASELTIYDLRFTIESAEIFDVLGNKLQSLKPQTVSIDISSLMSGIYFVKVKGENQERIGKFVKE